MRISVIIPTLNEAATLPSLIESLRALPGLDEFIIADGGSVDDTLTIARQYGVSVVTSPPGRGQQMNAAARHAQGDVLLFLHADTRLPIKAAACIHAMLQDAQIVGGNFTLKFDGGSAAARWLTFIYPFLRWGGMCYGDSALFVRRVVFEQLGGYRDFPLFEDVDLYRRLKRQGRFVTLAAQARTSARRFEGRFLRTFACWSCLQVLYWLGVSPVRLAQFYRPVR